MNKADEICVFIVCLLFKIIRVCKFHHFFMCNFLGTNPAVILPIYILLMVENSSKRKFGYSSYQDFSKLETWTNVYF